MNNDINVVGGNAVKCNTISPSNLSVVTTSSDMLIGGNLNVLGDITLTGSFFWVAAVVDADATVLTRKDLKTLQLHITLRAHSV